MPIPGTRWVSRNGRHAGVEVEVDHVSDLAVFLKHVGGNGTSWGNQKNDDSKTNRITIEAFRARYAPKSELVAGDAHGGGAGFRQRNAPKPKPVATAPKVPLSLNGHVLTGDSKLSIEVMEVTPMMAQAWLDRGGLNRHPSERRIDKYAAAMQRGEWQLTGEAIKLDANGTVRDGQQRLRAVVKAGVPITTLVVRNVEEQAFDVMDQGKTRLPSDVLGMRGYKFRTGLASAARGLILIERYGRYNVHEREAVADTSTPSIVRYVEQHPELEEALLLASRLQTGGVGGGQGLHAIGLALMLRVDADATRVFAESLASGANLPTDSPILLYRRRMLADKRIPNTAADREVSVATLIKTWNAWRKAETPKNLTWRGGNDVKYNREPFPMPV